MIVSIILVIIIFPDIIMIVIFAMYRRRWKDCQLTRFVRSKKALDRQLQNRVVDIPQHSRQLYQDESPLIDYTQMGSLVQ